MKKLKRDSMFYGKSTPIIVTIFADLFVSIAAIIFLDAHVKSNLKYLFWAVGSAALLFLSIYVIYLIIHRLTEEDKKKIAAARPPEWKQLPKTAKEHFTYDPKSIRIFAIIVIVVEIIFSIQILVETNAAVMLGFLGVVVSVTVMIFVRMATNERNWATMDETAVYAKIRIDHDFTVKERTKNRTVKTNYIVFYLPDGKYVLCNGEKKETPQEIIVIKYKNLVRWENSDNFKKYGGL